MGRDRGISDITPLKPLHLEVAEVRVSGGCLQGEGVYLAARGWSWWKSAQSSVAFSKLVAGSHSLSEFGQPWNLTR